MNDFHRRARGIESKGGKGGKREGVSAGQTMSRPSFKLTTTNNNPGLIIVKSFNAGHRLHNRSENQSPESAPGRHRLQKDKKQGETATHKYIHITKQNKNIYLHIMLYSISVGSYMHPGVPTQTCIEGLESTK